MDFDLFEDSGSEIVTFFSSENMNGDNLTSWTRRKYERWVFDILRFVSKDGSKESFFWWKFDFSLWSNLTYEKISTLNKGSHSNNSIFVEILQFVWRNIWDIISSLFRAKFGFSNIHRIFVDMNRSIIVFFHNSRTDDNRVLKVVTTPRHIRYHEISSKSELSIVDGLTISKDLSSSYWWTGSHFWLLVDNHVVIWSLKCTKFVGHLLSALVEYRNMLGIDSDDFSIFFRFNRITRAFSDHSLGSSSYDWRFSVNERNGLSHHVRSHFRTSRVIVFDEWNEGSRFRHDLFWRHIDMSNLTNIFWSWFRILSSGQTSFGKVSEFIDRCICFRNNEGSFLVGIEIFVSIQKKSTNFDLLWIVIIC